MRNFIFTISLGILPRLLFICIALIYSHLTFADENGIPFWLSGQYAAMAAVPSDPGWSLALTPYTFSGKSNSFPQDQGVNAKVSFTLLQLGYSSEEKILGGQPYIGLGWGVGGVTTALYATGTNLNGESNRSNSGTGGTDIYPLATLAWNKGDNNFMTYVTGGIPVGAYSANSLANVGIGHASIDAGGGYTYLSSKTGLEFSSVLGVTYNWMNNQTNYKSGVDSHLDWSLSKSTSQNWRVGIAGYVYRQLTGDSGSENTVGAFKSQIAAIGPQLGYVFNIGKKQVYINVSTYKEFWAKNRVEGYATIGTINIPLGN